jgi:hypothetical protein
LIDQIADINDLVATNDDVIATGAERIARPYRHESFTLMTNYFEPADDAPAMQIPVVKFILTDDVSFETIEVLLGQKLPGKKPRAAKTLEAAADGAMRDEGMRHDGSGCHNVLLTRRRSQIDL